MKGTVEAAALLTISLAFGAWEIVAWWITGASIVALLLLMTIDLLAAAAASPVNLRQQYPWRVQFTEKYFIIILVVVSAILDAILYAVVSYIPTNVAIVEEGWMLVTLATAFWFIGDQVWSIIGHFSDANPKKVAPPHLSIMAGRIRWLFQGIKQVDRARWGKDHKGDPQPTRWTDGLSDLTDEELEGLIEHLDRVRENRESPEDAAEAVEKAINEHDNGK